MANLVYLPVDTEERRKFLYSAVRARAGRFPYRREAPHELEDMVKREVMRPDAVARVIALEEDPDVFVGCFVVRPGLVVFAFTKEPLQQRGVMTTALADHGFDLLSPTPVLVWSAVASRIAGSSDGAYRIYPAIPEPRKAA